MFHPYLTGQLAAERRRDLLREADDWRLARAARHARTIGDDADAALAHRVWARLRRRSRPRIGLASLVSDPPSPGVPAQRGQLDRVIDLTSRTDGAVMFIGTAVATDSRHVVGWTGPLPTGTAATAGGTGAPNPVHAVDTAGYPACGAGRVSYVLLHTPWTEAVAGGCAQCAAALMSATPVPADE